MAASQAYKQEMQTAIFWTIFSAVALIAIVIAVTIMQFNAASEPAAIRALQGLGYTNVQIIEKQNLIGLGTWQGCDISDHAKFVASATNPSGTSTSMYICVSGERASVHF